MGENPLQLDKLFRKIKQFGGHARQGGGVCAIEMALWDIAGKVYNAPVYAVMDASAPTTTNGVATFRETINSCRTMDAKSRKAISFAHCAIFSK